MLPILSRDRHGGHNYRQSNETSRFHIEHQTSNIKNAQALLASAKCH
jgi:glycine cleavage system pyridoxal-binding protein P